MKWFWKLFLITTLAFSALAGVHSPATAEHETTAADIMRMWRADLDDDAILAFVRSYRACLRLSSTDLANMAEEGVSDYLISGLLAYVDRTGPCDGSGPYRVSRRFAPVFYSSYYFGLGVFPHWFYSDHHAHFRPIAHGYLGNHYGGALHYGGGGGHYGGGGGHYGGGGGHYGGGGGHYGGGGGHYGGGGGHYGGGGGHYGGGGGHHGGGH